MDIRPRAVKILDEFYTCVGAKPKHNAIDLRLEKDSCEKLADRLNNLLAWGDDTEIELVCNQLEPKLEKLKEKLVIEILKYGI